ncbi:LOW QUALITY PROTEIN: hypothetical protein OSB04_021987 [Centaurea solstitialis]|uniref:RING-type E3 ubiquitin transferase n=1 Tax=Centaurea solstitialis TaxID=347529 RepID=A0AA38SWV8_9ASTR|nr:LOW QUALITY PROTEIN: hypothetical protein OSB04_021987 [Centaurea solstitialis]
MIRRRSPVAAAGGNDVLKLLSGSFNCSFLPERPVTKWVGQGKRTCAICRTSIPPKMASQPRINSSLVIAIRMAKMTKQSIYTERAKKSGKANACSGKIFVTVPPDHFGPILSENDPERGMGVLVGETWEDRMECRQWGAHLPHVAGICGQSDYGAQSVALSGGYEDDEDHGEWFLYTGSGGRDLSGNKRTNKTQSFDQKFDKSNEALRVSCKKGYPVRVVRSHKEKRSAYAPEKGVRYDGIYRIEKCWRKPGIQGHKVCRYLFVRCDNDPAPWTSDENGDRPRPLPVIKELKDATDVTERKSLPSWDYDEEKASWLWKIPPPGSRKQADCRDVETGTTTKKVRPISTTEFCCLICHKVMNLPLTTPCAHNFCKSCLQDTFAGQTFIKERNCEGRRTLRAQKNVMKCPSCTNDISEYLQNPQVNRELMSVIESLQRQTKEMEENAISEEEMEETAVLGEEKLKIDEESGDVIVEDKEKEPEAMTELKDLSSKADDDKAEKLKDEVQDEVMEAVAVVEVVSDKSEPIAKPSPNNKPPKNKKRKVAFTDNAPNKKLHEEAAILMSDDVKPTGNDVEAVSLEKTEVSECKDKKVGEVGKESKKASKKRKMVQRNARHLQVQEPGPEARRLSTRRVVQQSAPWTVSSPFSVSFMILRTFVARVSVSKLPFLLQVKL